MSNKSDLTKINEVVSVFKNQPAFIFKGTKLTKEKIEYLRKTFPELKDAPIDVISRKNIRLIKEKLLKDGPGLEKRKRISDLYPK